MQNKVSKVYAKALMDLGPEKSELNKLSQELDGFAKLLGENEELRTVFAAELFRTDNRVAVMEALTEKLKVAPITAKVLKLLAKVNRVRELPGIAEQLKLMIMEKNAIIPLWVESREELGESQQKKIVDKFKKYFGAEVEAKYTVDRNLIGGIRVTAKGRTYDGTLATRLTRMKETLVGGR